jgi:L,D-transpeptidase ErfK/SrfK
MVTESILPALVAACALTVLPGGESATVTGAVRPYVVAAGDSPDNPLGTRWLALSAPGIGVHSTNQPGSIYRFGTHGCIRLHPDDMVELFDLVEVGTPVAIVYEPILVATYGAGTALLEVHRDIYGRAGALEIRVAALLQSAGLEHLRGTPAIRRIVAEKAGKAIVISP